MKFPFSRQAAVLSACGAMSLVTCTVRADDHSSTRSRPVRHARIALPSENGAVNSQTTDTKAPRNVSAGGTTGTETRALTGTNITKTYRRFGNQTDAAQPVFIIDRDDPRFTRSSTLSGVLRQLPFTTVGGR